MERDTRAAAWASIAFMALTLGARTRAQNRSGPAPQQKPPTAKTEIRVVTNEVTVPVTVTDKSGEFVLDLQQKDFHVFDDGVPQTIDHWELGGDPLAVALVIETSSRVHAMIPAIHSLGIIFTQTVMALDGEAAVITYDSDVQVPQPFTTDHDAVEKAVVNAKFEAPEMSLYDGMAKAVQMLAAQPKRWRRIMLVVGESQDDDSRTNLRQVMRDAELADISIYVVGPSSTAADIRGFNEGITPLKLPHLPVIRGAGPCAQRLPGGGTVPCVDLATPALWLLERGTNEIRHHQLEVAAAATGGIDYRAWRDSTLREALDRIGGELHAQYILTYRPNAPRAVGFHGITVSVSRPGVIVRARPAYYVGPAAN